MATLYYNAAVDTSWDTLGNWWQDSGYTTPAVSTPVDGDTVYIDAELDTGPNVADVTLVNIICASINSTLYSYYNINLTGSYQAIGPAEFDGVCFNGGTVSGDATFRGDGSFGTCAINQGTVTGNGTFIGAINGTGGNVYGDAYFTVSGYNSNYSMVQGNAYFEDYTFNFGYIMGDAAFSDFAVHNGQAGGTVYENATFSDFSSNTVNASLLAYPPTIVAPALVILDSVFYPDTFGNPGANFHLIIPQYGINGSSILGLI